MADVRRVHSWPFMWAAVLVFLVLGVLVGLSSGMSTSLAQSEQQTACSDVLDIPDLGAKSATVSAVAFVSPNDGWAVGSSSNSDAYPWFPAGTLFALHWNGNEWTYVPIPSPGTISRSIYAVWAGSANDVWAVGDYNNGTDTHNVSTLTMHWDGKQWLQIPIPGLGSLGTLSGVSGTSGGEVWASGSYYNPTQRVYQSFILHWDGTEWTPVQLPSLGSGSNQITSISARAANDVWAVGYYYQLQYVGYSITATLYLHWDGTAWKEVAGPTSERIVQLNGVVATGPDSAWAAGFDFEHFGRVVVTHWNGSVWNVVPTPEVAGIAEIGPNLRIEALSDDEVWVAGPISRRKVLTSEQALFVLHWDGGRWTELNIDRPMKDPTANSIASIAAGSMWVAGDMRADTNTNQRRPFLLRVSASPCPSPTPLPTLPVPTPQAPPVALPGSGGLFFPETGKTVSGVFLDYWNTHGGLAQQGYPISDVMGERSDLDGKVYTVQYFERAVFEYHPENAAPNNVLLSQLGTFEYKARYPYGAPNERANTDPGTIYFPETGKHLGGAFHYYWVNHGGLAQQGYPISEEFTEFSPVDGKPYTVQYFERAVFEYHPENRGTPYEVELSLLGRFRYDARYVTPPSTATATPTPQLIADKVHGMVAANERYLFWIADDPPVYSVHGYDLQTHKAFLVTDRPGIKFSITCDDKTVAWIEGDVSIRAGIKGYDISSHAGITLVGDRGPGEIKPDRLALSGDMLYYSASYGNTFGILARNWKSGRELLEVELGRAPALSGSELMYAEYAEDAQCTPSPCTLQNLYLHRLSVYGPGYLLSGVTAADHFREYNISGGHIVWVNPGTDTPKVVFFGNVDSGVGGPLAGTDANYPVVNDKLVIWSDHLRLGSRLVWSLKAYDISNDEIDDLYQLQTDEYVAPQAIIGGDMLAYTVGGSEQAPGGYLYLLRFGAH